MLWGSFRIAVSSVRGFHSGSEKPCLFRSYNEPRLNDDNSSWLAPAQTPLWIISRALISTPKYFSSIKIQGHVITGYKKELHNPSLVIFEEVMGTIDTTSNIDICFVSIGSGISGCSSVDAFSPSSSTNASVPENTAQKNKNYAYYRLNPGHKLGNVKFDDWETDKFGGQELTIDRITRATKEYLSDHSVRSALRAIAETLVRKRRASSEKANLERCGTLGSNIKEKSLIRKDRCFSNRLL